MMRIVMVLAVSFVGCAGPGDGDYKLNAESPISGSGLAGDPLRIPDGAFIGGTGISGAIPVFSSSATLAASVLLQKDGRIGLDKQEPAEKLHIGGNAIVEGMFAVGRTALPGGLQFFVNGGSAIENDGPGRREVLALVNLNGSNNDEPSLMFTGNTDKKNAYRLASIGGLVEDNRDGVRNGSLIFRTGAHENMTERMRISSTGNVGIGTSNPGSLGDGSSPTILAVHKEGFTSLGGLLELTTNQIAATTTVGAITFGSTGLMSNDKRIAEISALKTDGSNLTGTGDLVFSNWDAGRYRETARFKASGLVGIGTADPQSALQVSGYVQLDRTTGAPQAGDCSGPAHLGRMKVDTSQAGSKLWICCEQGFGGVWRSTTLQ